MNFPQDPVAVGQQIRQLRGEMTQTVFANMLGVTQSTLSRYEEGLIQVPQELLKLLEIGKPYWTILQKHHAQETSAQTLLESIGWHPGHTLEQTAALINLAVAQQQRAIKS